MVGWGAAGGLRSEHEGLPQEEPQGERGGAQGGEWRQGEQEAKAGLRGAGESMRLCYFHH